MRVVPKVRGLTYVGKKTRGVLFFAISFFLHLVVNTLYINFNPNLMKGQVSTILK